MEVVFVSSDSDKGKEIKQGHLTYPPILLFIYMNSSPPSIALTASFNEYFHSMPWKALPFEKSDIKSKLSTEYGIRGIPTLVILNAHTGALVSTEGRAGVMSNLDNPDGTFAGWKL